MSQNKNKRRLIFENLAHSDSKVKSEALEGLKSYLSEEDSSLPKYRKIWKALFYALWDADKRAFQNDLSEKISALLFDVYSLNEEALWIWLRAGFNILNREWNKIDYYRINKFMYLVRMLLTDICRHLEDTGFLINKVKLVNDILNEEVFHETNLNEGLALHIIQIFVSVLQKFSKLKTNQADLLFQPFIQVVSNHFSRKLRKTVIDNCFEKLCEDKKDGLFPGINLKVLSEKVMQIAAKKEINEPNRKNMYQLCEMLQETSNALKEKEEMNEQEKQGKKANKDKKKAKLAAELEPKETEESILPNKSKKKKELPVSVPIEKEKVKKNKKEKKQGSDKKVELEAEEENLNTIASRTTKRKRGLLNEQSEEEGPTVASLLGAQTQKKIKVKEDSAQVNQNNSKKKQNSKLAEAAISAPAKGKQPKNQKAKLIEEEVDDIEFNEEGLDDEDEMEEFDLEDFNEEDFEDMDDDDEEDGGIMGLYGGFMPTSKNYLKKLRAMYPNLPEYVFKTPKEKKKYFQDLNKKYLDKLKKERNTEKHSHTKKVVFALNKNNTLEFDREKTVKSLSAASQPQINKKKTKASVHAESKTIQGVLKEGRNVN